MDTTPATARRLTGGGRAKRTLVGLFVLLTFGGATGLGLMSGALEVQGLAGLLTWAFVGATCLGGVVAIRHGLTLSAPTVDLLLVPARPRLGEELELEWDVEGPTDRLRSLQFTLYAECTPLPQRDDEATGATRRLGSHRLGMARGDEVRAGSLRFRVPRAARATGDYRRRSGEQERVRWWLQIRGRVDGGIDVDDRYEVTVVARGRRQAD